MYKRIYKNEFSKAVISWLGNTFEMSYNTDNYLYLIIDVNNIEDAENVIDNIFRLQFLFEINTAFDCVFDEVKRNLSYIIKSI